MYFESWKWGVASNKILFKQTRTNLSSHHHLSPFFFLLCLDSLPQLPLVYPGKYCTRSSYSILPVVNITVSNWISLKPQIYQESFLVNNFFAFFFFWSRFSMSIWVIHFLSVTFHIFSRGAIISYFEVLKFKKEPAWLWSTY